MGLARSSSREVGGSFYGFQDPFGGGDYATRQFLAREFFSAPSVTPPLLGSVFVTTGNLGFTVPTVSGVTYRVEYVDTVGGTNWLTYSKFPGTGATIPVSIPTLGSQKFFRVVALP